MKIPCKLHFVGIGGIGMSGLAQMFKWLNCEVSGSDRDMDKPENARIANSLKSQSILMFPQDGSFIKTFHPDYIIYSTAIEKDNPDFTVSQAIPRIHRAEALSEAIKNIRHTESIAVAGSCGKTSVTGWIAETLHLMGKDPVMLGGGLVNRFSTDDYAGNFRAGKGKYFIYEADESDKSLLACSPDYAIILNTGTDHYPKDELLKVFEDFLLKVRKGAVIEENTFKALNKDCLKHLKISIFGESSDDIPDKWMLSSYGVSKGSASCSILSPEEKKLNIKLPFPGFHNALNAAAVLSVIQLLGINPSSAINSIESSKGIWRRFNLAGHNSKGAAVYDDYAHNVEKIVSCVKTAQEISKGGIFAVFQPHGFKPLAFMRDALFAELEKTLRDKDAFMFLPVFYAGGTASFEPKSEDVIKIYQEKGRRNYSYFESRIKLEKFIGNKAKKGDSIIVMGARDNSLSDFAAKIAKVL